MTLGYLIAIGGNLPKGKSTTESVVASAIRAVGDHIGQVTATSRLYRTPAFPPGSGPDFVNCAIAVSSDLCPEEVMTRLHDIEAEHGRTRTVRWGPRTLDLDLVAADQTVAPDAATWRRWHDLPTDRQRQDWPDQLILPHPRMQDRAFVLVPLMDIAPDWVHPVLKKSIRRMHAELTEDDRDAVRLLADPGCQ